MVSSQSSITGIRNRSSMLGKVPARCRQLFSNTVGQGSLALIDQAVVSGARFLTTVVVGRACGADDLGIYSLAFIFVLLSICIQESLVSTPFTVFSGRLRGRKLRLLAGSSLVHYAILSVAVVTFLAMLGALFSLGAELTPLARVFWVLASAMPFCLLRELARKFMFARLRIVMALAIDTVTAFVQLGGLLTLSYCGLLSPATAFAVMGLGCAVSGLGWVYLARSSFRPQLQHARGQLPQNWRFGKWLCAAQLLGTVHASIVPWFLALLIGTTATGRYAACLTLVLMANPFILGMVNFMTPKAVQAFVNDGNRGARRVTWITSLLFAGVIGSYCVFLLGFGDQMLGFVFGEEFVGGKLITVLAICSLIWAQCAAVSCGLAAIQRTDVSFRGEFLGLVTTVVAVPVMTLAWGSVGAAIGLLSGSMTSSSFQTIAFHRITR